MVRSKCQYTQGRTATNNVKILKASGLYSSIPLKTVLMSDTSHNLKFVGRYSSRNLFPCGLCINIGFRKRWRLPVFDREGDKNFSQS